MNMSINDIHVLTSCEVSSVRKTIKNDTKWSLIIDLMLYYFLSPEELCSLNIADIDFLSLQIKFATPTYAENKLIPLIPNIKKKLEAFLKIHKIGQKALFDIEPAAIELKLKQLIHYKGDEPLCLNSPAFRFYNITYITQSSYQVITILDKQNIRYLFIDFVISGMIDLKQMNIILQRHQVFINIIDLIDPKPLNILVLGGGGYVIPKYFEYKYKTCCIDTCEIDPEITKVARDYCFYNQTERHTVYHTDAYDYIKNCNKKYDVIFFDIPVFSDGKTNSMLLNNDFHKKYYNLLNENGILILNLLTRIEGDDSFLADQIQMVKKLYIWGSIFGTQGISGSDLKTSQNVLVFCGKGVDKITREKIISQASTINSEYKILADYLWSSF